MSDEIDKLLKAASGTLEKAKKLPYSHIDIKAFIAEHGLEPGDMPVAKALVYDYYLQWSKNPVGIKGFFTVFNRLIPKTKFNGIHCCKINPEAFKLPKYYSIARDTRFVKDAGTASRVASRYYGVYETFGYYIARLQTEENLHYLGRFKTAKEAALVYDQHASKHFGTEAELNFPGVGKNGKRKEAQIRKTTISGSEQ